MEMCFDAAEKYIESQSVRALAALAAPAWTKAVVGTAAAMVVESATPMCAKQLILEVMLLAYFVEQGSIVSWFIEPHSPL